MERAKKEVILYTKKDKTGKEVVIPIYMIDETLAKDFKLLVKKKEEYKNSFFTRNILPKDLLAIVESRTFADIRKELNINDQFKIEKDKQFTNRKYDNEPFLLRKAINTLKDI